MRLGTGEIIILLVLALIIFGPKKLPEMGRALGRSIKEFKEATRGASEEFRRGIEAEEETD